MEAKKEKRKRRFKRRWKGKGRRVERVEEEEGGLTEEGEGTWGGINRIDEKRGEQGRGREKRGRTTG